MCGIIGGLKQMNPRETYMGGNLKWYFARLSDMGPIEIAHRFVELYRKRRLAAITSDWDFFRSQGDEVFADLSGLRARLVLAGPYVVDDVLAQARFLGHKSEAIQDGAAAGSIEDWFVDPVSMRSWPGAQLSAFSVNVRSTSASPGASRRFGDVKFVWEPNRLQILQPLACIIAGGGPECEKAQAVALDIVSRWMAANPPYRGVNWVSGIELALRIVSVTLLVAALDMAALTLGQRRMLITFVRAHEHMLDRLPSLHSSANNHRVAEGLGLFLCGVLLPSGERKFRFRSQGRDILQHEALLQITTDGVGAEQSPSYQAFSMELIALGALIGSDTGNAFEQPVLERLLAGARFLSDLQFGDGEVPGIGDDDEGRVILAPHVDEPNYVASVCTSVAALCDLNSETTSARPGYLRERLFGVPLKDVEARLAPGLRVYEKGGYSVLRRDICGHKVHLVFDHGPLGYLSLAAHGHADALSIWLTVDEKPVFVDAGTWLYHSGEIARNTLRSSQSHNTLSIGGLSQSEPSAAFSWKNKAHAWQCGADESLAVADANWAMAGEHDGYKGRLGIVHRREILGRVNGFVIADRLSGDALPQPVEIAFLCHPAIEIVMQEGVIELWRREQGMQKFVLRMRAPEGFTVHVTGAEDPAGLPRYSPRFGETTDTARVLLIGQLGTQPCLTLFEFETKYS